MFLGLSLGGRFAAKSGGADQLGLAGLATTLGRKSRFFCPGARGGRKCRSSYPEPLERQDNYRSAVALRWRLLACRHVFKFGAEPVGVVA